MWGCSWVSETLAGKDGIEAKKATDSVPVEKEWHDFTAAARECHTVTAFLGSDDL